MKKIKCYRHGEITFVKILKKDLPIGLKQTEQTEFLKGSHGNPHTFDKGKLYLKRIDDYVFGYFEAKDTTLYHKEHGEGKGQLKKAKLPNGVYELRQAIEFVNGELKPVID